MQQKSTPDEPSVPSRRSNGRSTARLQDRYATALYELAQATDTVDTTGAELAALQAAIASAPDFARTLQNPVLNRAAQGAALSAIAVKLGMSKVTVNFLKLVAQKGRQAALPQIIAAYQAIAANARGELLAEVCSAAPLSDTQTQQLTAALARKHDAPNIRLQTTIDPSLLGGFSVRIGTVLYDRTIASQLNRLLLKLKEAA